MAPPPPPPPPPLCLPFFGGKKNRRLTYSERSATEDYSSRRSSIDRLGSQDYSPTATLTSHAEKLTFSSETESFEVPEYSTAARDVTPGNTLKRSNTISGSTVKEKSGGRKWGYGYGWGLGRKDKSKGVSEKQAMADAAHNSNSTPPPGYNSPGSDGRSRSTSHSQSRRTADSHSGHHSYSEASVHYQSPSRRPSLTGSIGSGSIHYVPPPNPKRSNTYKSNTTRGSGGGRSGASRPGLYPSESSSTLVGSALERKIRDEDPIKERQDTGSRLESIRDIMRQQELDY